MKNVKKLLSIVMVLTLVLSLGASAFAATVTIADGAPDHDFVAYQVFKGTTTTIEGKGEVLASIEWADGVSSVALLEALNTAFPGKFPAGTTAEKAAEVMNEVDKQALARALGAAATGETKLLGTGVTIEDDKTDLSAGYYVIVDATDVSGDNDSKNAIVLEVVGDDVVVNSKYDVPESQKKVQDKNDTTGETSGWQDSADWDIGDKVPFQLAATLPTNLSEYATYTLVFHDKQSEGLTFDKDSVAVYWATKNADGTYTKGEKITAGYTVNETNSATETFNVTIPDVKTVTPAAAEGNNAIVIEYESTLNDNAKIGGAEGNPNTMYMEFSNNPGGEGTGKTPEDTVIVFTFDFDANKVDENGDALSGATFSLYKEVASPAADGTYTYMDADYNVVEAGAEGAKAYEKKTLTKNEDGNVFSAKGLDDGNYVLVEDEAPAGYNKAGPWPFTVEATHTDGDAPALSELVVKDADGTDISDGTEGASFKVDLNKGNVSTNIKNQSGATLPETGGIGTTIFYIVGAVLVAGAVILLVTKKRVSGAEK